MLSKTYGDAEKIRSLIQDHMLETYDKVLGIASNCPTRFAISHMITLDLWEAKGALKSACTSDEWDIAAAFQCKLNDSDPCTRASVMTGPRWFC